MIQRLTLTHDATMLDEKVDVDAAYSICADVTREKSKSFYFSTHFLPAEQRKAIRAFYAFCRATDDMVDLPPAGPASVAAHNLTQWREHARLPRPAQRNPILSAWADTRERYSVPQRYIEELIDGCEMDLRICRYETFAQLREYCYRVASTVGLVSMHIIGVVDDSPAVRARASECAATLGVALQLTNILRDVGEDLARGRIYLPQEDLRRFHYGESDLRAGIIDDRFRALMQFEIARAHTLYDSGWNGIAYLQPEGRLAVGAAIALYRCILDRIVRNGYDVFTRRAHISTLGKLCRVPGIYLNIQGLTLAEK